MYKHEILTDLPKFQKVFQSLRDPTIDVMIRGVTEALKCATEVYFGDDRELFSLVEPLLKGIKSVYTYDYREQRIPYPTTLYSSYGVDRATAMLLHEIPEEEAIVLIEFSLNTTNGKRDPGAFWEIMPSVFGYYYTTKDREPISRASFTERMAVLMDAVKLKGAHSGFWSLLHAMAVLGTPVGVDGTNAFHGLLPFYAMVYSKAKDITDKQINLQVSDFSVMLQHGILLSCKNVVQKKIVPDISASKRRMMRLMKRVPADEYYVLEIKSHNESSGESSGESSAKRLHMCRGHFATYTEEKKLFGRYVGRYWIPAHMKGNPELGTIEKDYEVKHAEC
jgi:hypothetical protein